MRRLRAIEIMLSSFGALMAAFRAIAFEQPTTEERLKAIGPTDALPRALKRALTIEGFAPLCAPRQQDWLAVHPESGQAFEEFRRAQPNRPAVTVWLRWASRPEPFEHR